MKIGFYPFAVSTAGLYFLGVLQFMYRNFSFTKLFEVSILMVVPTLIVSFLLCAVAHSQTFSVLYNFTGGADGSNPSGNLSKDPSGNLYGVTIWGGASGRGVLFKLDTSNHESVLHNFGANSKDGEFPERSILRDKGGNLFGTTRGGGDFGQGTVFKIDTNNEETILHNFTGGADSGSVTGGADGASPLGLSADLSKNVFGTTFAGGDPLQCGVIYMIDPSSGVETVLYTFLCQLDGGVPSGPVTADPSGNLYGCTGLNGADGGGTLYKLDPTGNLTVLHDFGENGYGCFGGITRDAAGNLYGNTGTTNYGNGDGVVFKLDASGNYSVLHTFTGSKHDGASPTSGLILDNKGFLYGATQFGGAFREGTVYRIKASTGAFVVIHSFLGPDGANPAYRLSRDAQGNIYGTTLGGGSYGFGVVFKIAP